MDARDYILKAQMDRRTHIVGSFTNANELSKGGEGSKGGQVIGHTANGTAIYAHTKTGIAHVDEALAKHGAHVSTTHKIAQMALSEVHDKLKKQGERLAGKTAASGDTARKLKQTGDAVGVLSVHLAAHKKSQEAKDNSTQK